MKEVGELARGVVEWVGVRMLGQGNSRSEGMVGVGVGGEGATCCPVWEAVVGVLQGLDSGARVPSWGH